MLVPQEPTSHAVGDVVVRGRDCVGLVEHSERPIDAEVAEGLVAYGQAKPPAGAVSGRDEVAVAAGEVVQLGELGGVWLSCRRFAGPGGAGIGGESIPDALEQRWTADCFRRLGGSAQGLEGEVVEQDDASAAVEPELAGRRGDWHRN
jgi:hypothetical protein